MAKIPITISNSIKVKPAFEEIKDFTFLRERERESPSTPLRIKEFGKFF